MFENLQDRIAGTVLLGLDVAVEFATLGEYRLVDPGFDPAPIQTTPDPGPRRRLIELADVDFTLLPRPSTALARATAPAGTAVATPSVVVATPCQGRRRGGGGVRHVVAPDRAPRRSRGGAVPPPAQLCLPLDA
jgi:hypothetical protein